MSPVYSKTCLNLSQMDKTKTLITDSNLMKVESIAECSAILLTCIKRYSVLKLNAGLLFGWPLKTGFTVISFNENSFHVGSMH